MSLHSYSLLIAEVILLLIDLLLQILQFVPASLHQVLLTRLLPQLGYQVLSVLRLHLQPFLRLLICLQVNVY